MSGLTWLRCTREVMQATARAAGQSTAGARPHSASALMRRRASPLVNQRQPLQPACVPGWTLQGLRRPHQYQSTNGMGGDCSPPSASPGPEQPPLQNHLLLTRAPPHDCHHHPHRHRQLHSHHSCPAAFTKARARPPAPRQQQQQQRCGQQHSRAPACTAAAAPPSPQAGDAATSSTQQSPCQRRCAGPLE